MIAELVKVRVAPKPRRMESVVASLEDSFKDLDFKVNLVLIDYPTKTSDHIKSDRLDAIAYSLKERAKHDSENY